VAVGRETERRGFAFEHEDALGLRRGGSRREGTKTEEGSWRGRGREGEGGWDLGVWEEQGEKGVEGVEGFVCYLRAPWPLFAAKVERQVFSGYI